ncbi:MAG: hypothetical protein D6820_17690 [Lentisphaerae bacterium]|nr:MAG: hypothetical protein D6820_17690 [Lentisphaerota bacterium]
MVGLKIYKEGRLEGMLTITHRSFERYLILSRAHRLLACSPEHQQPGDQVLFELSGVMDRILLKGMGKVPVTINGRNLDRVCVLIPGDIIQVDQYRMIFLRLRESKTRLLDIVV